MKIDRFSMENYRSIVKKQEIDLKDMSIIIGPNNEGKSNILNAITYALSILTEYKYFLVGDQYRYIFKKSRLSIGRMYNPKKIDSRSLYDWIRDFPVGKQNKDPNGKTVFEIVFDLRNDELVELNGILGLNLSDEIIFTLKLGHNSSDINIGYPANKRINLNNRRGKILEYLSEHIVIEYIGSVRTTERTTSLIESLIEKDMDQLRENKDYERLFASAPSNKSLP